MHYLLQSMLVTLLHLVKDGCIGLFIHRGIGLSYNYILQSQVSIYMFLLFVFAFFLIAKYRNVNQKKKGCLTLYKHCYPNKMNDDNPKHICNKVRILIWFLFIIEIATALLVDVTVWLGALGILETHTHTNKKKILRKFAHFSRLNSIHAYKTKKNDRK